MNLPSRTLKSFTRKEKAALFFLIALLLLSFYKLFLSSEQKIEQSKGKIYTEGLVGEIKHINPVFTEFSDADRDISSLVFSGLVKYNSATGIFEEDMATHTLSEDKLTYTFTLQNEVFWHDGTEVSADDIYFTFAEVIQSPDFRNPILKSNFDGLKIEKVNERTVSFTLSSPNSFFFSGMTVGLLPKHILGEVPVSELDIHEFNQNPIGTGPYKVTGPYSVDEQGNSTISLEVFPEYYGKEHNLKNIRFIAFPTITELIANQDIWQGAARIRQSLLNEIEIEESSIYRYELPQYTALFLNTDSEKLSKNKMRLGISKAIDKEEILAASGHKVRIDTPLLELDQEGWIHTKNLDESQGALYDAGWSLKEGNTFRTNEDGEELTIRLVRRDFSGSNEPQEETADITAKTIKSQLAAVGIDVIIETYPMEQLQTIIANRDYDMMLYGQSLGYNLDTFSYWHSSQANSEGLNLSNYQNAKADFLIESIRGNFDPEEHQALLNDLGEIIVEDVPAVFLYTPSYYYVTCPKLSGIKIENLLLPVDRFANIAEWSIN